MDRWGFEPQASTMPRWRSAVDLSAQKSAEFAWKYIKCVVSSSVLINKTDYFCSLNVSVHLIFLGSLPIFQFFSHFLEQKYLVAPVFSTNILPVPGAIFEPQKEHLTKLSTFHSSNRFHFCFSKHKYISNSYWPQNISC